MPRIDPLQLLKCLGVLLSPNGGIKSRDEVQRLASLMTKFSKKLVSKCIYVQILKNTKTDLLGMFMGAGGWNLTHSWLSDGISAKNWPLIQELLELLLMCPVDIERLKTNNCPKLIKGLSKEGSNENVRLLASKLVEQWLKIVKGETSAEVKVPQSTEPAVKVEKIDPPQNTPAVPDSVGEDTGITKEACKAETPAEPPSEVISIKQETTVVANGAVVIKKEDEIISEESGENSVPWDAPIGQLPVYKITIRDGKQVLAKVHGGDKLARKSSDDSASDSSDLAKNDSKGCNNKEPVVAIKRLEDGVSNKTSSDLKNSSLPKCKPKLDKTDTVLDAVAGDSSKVTKDIPKKSKEQSVSKIEKKSKLGESSVKSKVKDGAKDKTKDSKGKDKGKEKSKDSDKESAKSKEKDKDKDRKVNSEKFALQAEKDKATLAKLIPPAISKLGKIPRKTDSQKSGDTSVKKTSEELKRSSEAKKPATALESKKSSISIEVRKPSDSGRPKTVKTFNSKFRSTGLEEEVKPPPSRAAVKKITPAPEKKKLPNLKRPSPTRETAPPEKKLKPSLIAESSDAKRVEKAGGIKLIAPRPKRKQGDWRQLVMQFFSQTCSL